MQNLEVKSVMSVPYIVHLTVKVIGSEILYEYLHLSLLCLSNTTLRHIFLLYA